MGLFDFLKNNQQAAKSSLKSPIPESEKKYYQSDDYYTDTVPIMAVGSDGKYGQRKVITFEERKKISYPSQSGLFVAEILLLEYCSYGTYPHPKNGYPGFWWFEYGIRDVGSALKTLEQRKYIEFGSATDQLPKMTIPQLKEISSKFGIKASGNKASIIAAILDNVTENDLLPIITERKYRLTEKGKQELEKNAYVPFMHKVPDKTIDVDFWGPVFNVWEVNRRIGKTGRTDWQKIVEEIREEQRKYQQTKVEKSKKFKG